MTDLEKRADEYVSNKADKGNFDIEKFGRAYFSESSMKQALVNFAKAETALLSQHIIDLQKDKGNLTDRVRELEQQIEKMKCCYNCEHGQNECYCSIKHSDICDLSCWDKGCEDWRLRR